MVSGIFISKNTRYRPMRSVISLSQYVMNQTYDTDNQTYDTDNQETEFIYDENLCHTSFNNLTAYFTDLKYWDSYDSLHMKYGNEVLVNIKKAIEQLEEEGVIKYNVTEDEDWGIIAGSNLSNDIRKQILLFHLYSILDLLNNLDDLENQYFIVD